MLKNTISTTIMCILAVVVFLPTYSVYTKNKAISFASSDAEIPIPRSVQGDKGQYYLINKKRSGKHMIVIHKRVGVYETVYTRTQINCANMTFKILGQGRTEGTIRAAPWDWTTLVADSSKSDLLHFVCR